MSRVTMTHPNLPGQPIEVEEASASHYQSAGWQRADLQQQKPKAAARRRRQTPNGDET